MNSLKNYLTTTFFSLLILAFSSQIKAQVDPSAYANGIKAIVEINSKGEIKALKMAPPRFKTQLHRIAVKLTVQNNRLKMEPLGIINDTLIYVYIKQPMQLTPSMAKSLGISNPKEAKLRKGMIPLSNKKRFFDLPTTAPLKVERRK